MANYCSNEHDSVHDNIRIKAEIDRDEIVIDRAGQKYWNGIVGKTVKKNEEQHVSVRNLNSHFCYMQVKINILCN